jgi:hypothetical protein
MYINKHIYTTKGYFSSHTGNSRGIAILINNTFKYNVHNEIIDKEGNYLILDNSRVSNNISCLIWSNCKARHTGE